MLVNAKTRDNALWKKFAETKPFGDDITCSDIRDELSTKILAWAAVHPGTASLHSLKPLGIADTLPQFESLDWLKNTYAANALRNHISSMEGRALHPFANPKGADFDQGAGVWGSLRKVFSIEPWEKFFFGEENGGSLDAAGAANELSKLLKIASEVKGRILFYLIAIFPFFLFWAALRGVFGPLLFWTSMYFAIAMWEPLWSLSYNILIAQMNAHKYLAALGELNDAISITAAETVRLRFNQAIQAYVLTQFGIAATVTSFAFWMSKGWLQQKSDSSVPGGWLVGKLI